jgi:SPP1 gp7 family putative phage head morphogenesis protein
VLGINPIASEPYLRPVISAFVEENVSLIKSIPTDGLKAVEGIVRRGVQSGDSTRKIIEKIRKRFKVDRNRAALIANDQIGKFLGSLDNFRQTEIGITHYFWDTVGDERVRNRHRALNNKRFSWKKPPISGTAAERLHPGFPVRCRCSARPDLSVFN